MTQKSAGMRRSAFVRAVSLGLLLFLGGCSFAQSESIVSNNEDAPKSKGSTLSSFFGGLVDAVTGGGHRRSLTNVSAEASTSEIAQEETAKATLPEDSASSHHDQKSHEMMDGGDFPPAAEEEHQAIAQDSRALADEHEQLLHNSDGYKKTYTQPPRTSPPAKECVDAEIHFDEIGLEPGDYLSDQFKPFYGLTFTSSGRGALGDHPRIFDSANPYKKVGGTVCGDKDLGAPNTECPGGGPGRGVGGEPGSDYENCDPQGNVLIIQEDNRDNVCGDIPDDNQEGGTMTLKFSPMLPEFYDVTLLDVDYPVKIIVVYLDENGRQIEKDPINLPLTGNNSLQTVTLNEQNVVELRFQLRRSAAITNLRFCYTPPDVPTKRPTPQPITPGSPAPTPK